MSKILQTEHEERALALIRTSPLFPPPPAHSFYKGPGSPGVINSNKGVMVESLSLISEHIVEA